MSCFRFAAIISSLILTSSLACATPITYTIGSKLSRVTFSVDHQGFIQSYGVMKINPGSFVFDNQDWSKSSVAVTMPIKTLNMGDDLWNQQIRKDDSWTKLFQYPSISFESKQIKRIDATHGTLIGDLTLAGVTKSVALQLRVNKIGINAVSEEQSVGFTATGTLKRSQFGLDAYEDLVSDDLSVQIQLEAFVGPDPDVGPATTSN